MCNKVGKCSSHKKGGRGQFERVCRTKLFVSYDFVLMANSSRKTLAFTFRSVLREIRKNELFRAFLFFICVEIICILVGCPFYV